MISYPDVSTRAVSTLKMPKLAVPTPAVPVRIAVILATKGRAEALPQVIGLLETQSLAPSIVIISATAASDINVPLATDLNVEYVFGPTGSAAQRNSGLQRVRGRADVAVFFDDDFAPAGNWIEQCAGVFSSDSDIAGVNGIVIRDGAKTQPISWQEARHLIAVPRPADPRTLSDIADLYGCNMAFRMAAIDGMEFDERLALYSWLEDKEFSRQAAKRGRLVECNSLIGVHLGLQSGRVSGKRYGYSQVVNAWYLYKKGAFSLNEALIHIMKPLIVNITKSLLPANHIDRRGRLHGNLVGLAHLLSGDCRPEKVTEL
jgi:glycosyltransferase involved in cell wall biosynthesis